MIPMPTNFGSMREILGALNEAIPHNNFLRNWLQNKVQGIKQRSRGGQVEGAGVEDNALGGQE